MGEKMSKRRSAKFRLENKKRNVKAKFAETKAAIKRRFNENEEVEAGTCRPTTYN